MAIEKTESGAIVITGEHIQLARLISLKHMIKLEELGLKRRGQSATAIVKRELGIRGNRKTVLKALEERIAGF